MVGVVPTPNEQLPGLATQSSDKTDKRCRECCTPMPPDARKCVECESYQDYRRYLLDTSSTVSLIAVCLSVVSILVTAWSTARKYSDIQIAFINRREGTVRFDRDKNGTDEAVTTFVVEAIVSNKGNASGTIQAFYLGTKEDKRHYDMILFSSADEEKDRHDIVPTAIVVYPGETTLVAAHVMIDDPKTITIPKPYVTAVIRNHSGDTEDFEGEVPEASERGIRAVWPPPPR